jgi:hypothetical protein
MGILNEIKKEWTWDNTIQQWPDFLAILPAVYFAERYGIPCKRVELETRYNYIGRCYKDTKS